MKFEVGDSVSRTTTSYRGDSGKATFVREYEDKSFVFGKGVKLFRYHFLLDELKFQTIHGKYTTGLLTGYVDGDIKECRTVLTEKGFVWK